MLRHFLLRSCCALVGYLLPHRRQSSVCRSLSTPRSTTLSSASWVIIAISVSTACGADVTSTWIGGAGLWEEPTNWNHVGDPGADFPNNDTLTYDVVVSSGNAQLESSSPTVNGLTLNGGMISTADTISGFRIMDVAIDFDFSSGTIGDVLLIVDPGAIGTWSGGTVQDEGQLINQGTLDITGSDHSITGTGSLLDNDGVATWQVGSGSTFHLTDRGVIVNRIGAEFNIDGSGNSFLNGAGVFGGLIPGFQNGGTLTKTGAGTTEFNVFFDGQLGTLDIQQGAVIFKVGGQEGDGSSLGSAIRIAQNASLIVDGAKSAIDNFSQFKLDGTLDVRSGLLRVGVDGDSILDTSAGTDVVRVSGGSLQIAYFGGPPITNPMTLSHIELSGGRLGIVSPEVHMSATGSFDWSGGEFYTPGEGFTVPLTTSMSMSGPNLTLGGFLDIAGSATWTPDDQGQLQFGGQLLNRGSFTIDIPFNESASIDVITFPALVENRSTLTKNSGGLLRIYSEFLQTAAGTTHVDGGQIELLGETELHGTFILDNVTEFLVHPSGGFGALIDSDAQFTGTGAAVIGSFSGINAPVIVRGSFANDTFLIFDGVVQLESNLIRDQLRLEGATIDGPGDIVITANGPGLFAPHGNIAGSGAFLVNGDATLGLMNFESRAAVFNGDVTMNGSIGLSQGAHFTSNGNFLAGTNNDVSLNADATSAFHFHGVTSFLTDFNVTVWGDLFNTGRIQMASFNAGSTGTVDFNGRYVQTAGAMVLANGQLNADRLEIQGGSFFAVSNPFAPVAAHVANARYLGGVASTLSLEGTTIEGLFPISAPGTNLTIGDAAAFDGFYTDGTIRVGSKTLTILNAGYANLGVLTNLNGGTLVAANGIALGGADNFTGTGTVNAKVAAAAGSIIQATGNLSLGDATSAAGFHSDGELRVGTGIVTIMDSNQTRLGTLVTLGNGGTPGTLAITNGAVVDFDQAITGTGTINSTNTLAKAVINNGAISGNSSAQRITLSGYVKGVGTFDNVNFTGTFSPGLSPTILAVSNVALSPTSTLIMELGGTAPGSGYDQIQSSGELAFDGTLQVALINGFTPAAGQSFNLFDWLSTTGTFDTLFLPTLDGLAWNTSQLYTTGVFSVAAAGIPGDYNNNGIVDAGDYVLWRKHNNSAVTLSNDSTPGTSAADYDVWRAHFGQLPGSGSGASGNIPAPEPATLVMPITAVAGWCLRRRHSGERVPRTR